MFVKCEETDPLIAEKEIGIRIRITNYVTSFPKFYNSKKKSWNFSMEYETKIKKEILRNTKLRAGNPTVVPDKNFSKMV